MNMLKRKGPRTDPCGTPIFILFAVLLCEPIFYPLMAAIQIAIHEAEAVEIKSIRLQFCDKEVFLNTMKNFKVTFYLMLY